MIHFITQFLQPKSWLHFSKLMKQLVYVMHLQFRITKNKRDVSHYYLYSTTRGTGVLVHVDDINFLYQNINITNYDVENLLQTCKQMSRSKCR